jgi:pimeloyl-ACP methyl ester carboxylesterase
VIGLPKSVRVEPGRDPPKPVRVEPGRDMLVRSTVSRLGSTRTGWVTAILIALNIPALAQTAAQTAPVMVKLPTGSELATWTIAPVKPSHKTPVIFLHGGPGMYTTEGAKAKGAAFRAAGFTTVYFDQAGGGKSKAIPAAGYTIERAIADVEALRAALGHERVILWGSSYGASLATLYADRFPARTAGVILTSPGSYPGTKPKRDYGITNRNKVKIGKELSSAVRQIDSKGAAAEASLPQSKVNPLFDALVNDDLMGGMVCKDSTLKPTSPGTGGNVYGNRLIDKSLDAVKFKPAGAFKFPALVVRGSCDFMPLSNAERLAALYGTTVVTVPNTGHGLVENPAALEAAFTAFARGTLAGVE